MSDYERAKRLGLTEKDRWSTGIEHHPMSERLMAFLMEHDFCDYNDSFLWVAPAKTANMHTSVFAVFNSHPSSSTS